MSVNKIFLVVISVLMVNCGINNSSKMKTHTNKRGEIFTFHKNGTASVQGPFGENLGTYKTNNSNPIKFDKVQLCSQWSSCKY